ncbi:MAG: hypothetical protein LBR53_10915 [Deltaproteobacteria bacterium]|nr:hypothetical protein [Deltaproteobacteria bacterium]
MNYIDFFGLKTFFWFAVAGSAIGFTFGLSLVIFLGRRGAFKRENRFYDFLIKGFYLYVPAVMTVTALFLSFVIGLWYETGKLFSAHEEDLIRASRSAAGRAFSDIHAATGGGSLPSEFFPNVSEVLAVYVDESAFQALDGNFLLLEIAGPVRYALKMGLKNAFENALLARYPRVSEISADEFYVDFQSSVLESLREGFYPDFFWDELSSQFTPLCWRIFWTAFLFLFPVCFELFLFRLFKRRRVERRRSRGEGSSGEAEAEAQKDEDYPKRYRKAS